MNRFLYQRVPNAEVIPIRNFMLLSSIVLILWGFEKFTLFDCDLICDYPVTASLVFVTSQTVQQEILKADK